MEASYFDGKSSRRQRAELDITQGVLRLSGDFGRREVPLERVEIGEALASAPRSLRFADGAYCEVSDRAALEALLTAAGWQESAVVRVQRRWSWAAGALAGFIAFAAASYFFLLPWLAATIAPRLAPELASAISNRALSQLDDTLLHPSKLPAARQQAIAAQLAAVEKSGDVFPKYQLHFRAGPKIGPNAFALPDGQIVLLDELVALAENDRQLVAVLTHELGHVEHQHGMKQLIQSTVVSLVAGAWFGDISSVAASLGALALGSGYSRQFEYEADHYAGRRLLASYGDTDALAQVLTRLAGHAERRSASGLPRLLASHPDPAQRIARLGAMNEKP